MQGKCVEPREIDIEILGAAALILRREQKTTSPAGTRYGMIGEAIDTLNMTAKRLESLVSHG